jgi:multidrug efflux pump subunit AcrA (membrane-fusion protein)
MCDPVSISLIAATTAISMGTSMASASAQAQQAKAQEEAAQQAHLLEQQALAERQLQEAESASDRQDQVNLEAQRAASTAQLTAAEAGVGGGSVRARLAQIERDRMAGVVAVQRNEEVTQAQLGRQREGRTAQLSRELTSIDRGPGMGMAALTGGLSGVSTGLSIAGGVKDIRKKGTE